MSLALLLALAAFVCILASPATGRVPLWVGALLLSLAVLVQLLPLR